MDWFSGYLELNDNIEARGVSFAEAQKIIDHWPVPVVTAIYHPASCCMGRDGDKPVRP